MPLNSQQPIDEYRWLTRKRACRFTSAFYFTKGWPGDKMASLCSLAVMRARSASVLAEAKRLRNWTIFSFRVRRRRISGRRLGADMERS
jgi:hypothetical protein